MKKCDYCQQGKPLVIGKTDDYGVSINNIGHVGYNLVAYGYDVHGTNTNGLMTKINYCPICGRNLNQVESEVKGMNITDINFAIDVLRHPQFDDRSDIDKALDIAFKSLQMWKVRLEVESNDKMMIGEHQRHLLDTKNMMLGSAYVKKRDSLDYAINVIDKYQKLQSDYENLRADLEAILDKIKANIEEYKSKQLTFAIGVEDLEKGKQVALDYVLAMLDNYKIDKVESEDKE